MIKAILPILIVFCSVTINAQIIKGIVTDKKENPLPGANVFIEGSYDGASTDQDGEFSFETSFTGKHTLIVRYVGFLEYRKEIDITSKGADLNIILKESSKNLNAVVITAGSFEASDEKKGVVMKPLDVVTTAGGLGDIYGAMNTLPGTQLVGEEGKVFVRGGDSYETKTFFDGMRIEKPYYERVPDFPTRGRFSPWLFSGTVFSSGGVLCRIRAGTFIGPHTQIRRIGRTGYLKCFIDVDRCGRISCKKMGQYFIIPIG